MRRSLLRIVSVFIVLYVSFGQMGHAVAMQELAHHGKSSLCDEQQSCVVHVHQDQEKSIFQPISLALKHDSIPYVQVFFPKDAALLISHSPKSFVVIKNRLLTVQQLK